MAAALEAALLAPVEDMFVVWSSQDRVSCLSKKSLEMASHGPTAAHAVRDTGASRDLRCGLYELDEELIDYSLTLV
jgi:hypothetical protein